VPKKRNNFDIPLLALVIIIGVSIIYIYDNPLSLVVSIILGAYLYDDSRKRRFRRYDSVWLFALGMLDGLLGVILYLLTRPKKGQKPAIKWKYWIILSIFLFCVGLAIGFLNYGQSI